MSQHDMGPSTIAGFHEQCRKCGALDNEIRFALGRECPVKDPSPEELSAQENLDMGAAIDAEIAKLKAEIGPTYTQRVAMMQLNWMIGYTERQYVRAGQSRKTI